MSEQQFCLKWSNFHSNMSEVFHNMLQSESMVDVTIACEGASLKAHKIVLAACSPFFQSLFMSNSCKHPIVILEDVRFVDLKATIDFMYKGEVSVSQSQLESVLKAAESLKIKGLTDIVPRQRDSVTTCKRIASDEGVGDVQVGDIIEEIVEEIAEAEQNGEQKFVQVVYRKGERHRKRRKKLINELTASDYSEDESDPEFKCNVKLDSISSPVTEVTLDDEKNPESTLEDQKSGNETEREQSTPRPTRILPKRNAGRPRKSLSPSPTRREVPRKKSQHTVDSKLNLKAKKMASSTRISDPINASDYFYYKSSYNVNPPNLPNIYAPPVNQQLEFIIEL